MKPRTLPNTRLLCAIIQQFINIWTSPPQLAKYFELSGGLKERGVYKNGIRVGKWEFYLDGEVVDAKKQRETRKNNIKQKN